MRGNGGSGSGARIKVSTKIGQDDEEDSSEEGEPRGVDDIMDELWRRREEGGNLSSITFDSEIVARFCVFLPSAGPARLGRGGIAVFRLCLSFVQLLLVR